MKQTGEWEKVNVNRNKRLAINLTAWCRLISNKKKLNMRLNSISRLNLIIGLVNRSGRL